MKNKFIVFEGLDGSGKNTQSELLIKFLKDNDFKLKTISFPQYGEKSAGMVEEYLKKGKYGTAKEVDPKIASVFYACDRYDGSFKIRKWLNEGYFVIADRYVSSNAGHQGGKIENDKKRKEFINWLYDLEYDLFKIPKPDLVLFLKTTPEFSFKKTKERGEGEDIHEGDLEHLKGAYRAYMSLVEENDNFKVIDVTEKDKFLPKEVIADKIKKIVL